MLRRYSQEDDNDERQFKENDVVWAKQSTFQYWPGVIIKSTGKAKDGSRTFEVKFYGWDAPSSTIKLRGKGKAKSGATDIQRFQPGQKAEHERLIALALTCKTMKKREGAREQLEKAIEQAETELNGRIDPIGHADSSQGHAPSSPPDSPPK